MKDTLVYIGSPRFAFRFKRTPVGRVGRCGAAAVWNAARYGTRVTNDRERQYAAGSGARDARRRSTAGWRSCRLCWPTGSTGPPWSRPGRHVGRARCVRVPAPARSARSVCRTGVTSTTSRSISFGAYPGESCSSATAVRPPAAHGRIPDASLRDDAAEAVEPEKRSPLCGTRKRGGVRGKLADRWAKFSLMWRVGCSGVLSKPKWRRPGRCGG
jgi:hypothetical protein